MTHTPFVGVRWNSQPADPDGSFLGEGQQPFVLKQNKAATLTGTAIAGGNQLAS
jgi:hypothetical protein